MYARGRISAHQSVSTQRAKMQGPYISLAIDYLGIYRDNAMIECHLFITHVWCESM